MNANLLNILAARCAPLPALLLLTVQPTLAQDLRDPTAPPRLHVEDASTSEVFQGVMTLLHSAMNELDLADLPRRGAWGSVTAKNFPVALSEAFERAIISGARKRGRV